MIYKIEEKCDYRQYTSSSIYIQIMVSSHIIVRSVSLHSSFCEDGFSKVN